MLEKKGVSVRYTKMIKDMHNGEVTSVRTTGGNTSEFQIIIS